MSRKEAEELLQFELTIRGILMQEYVAKLKAHPKEDEKEPIWSRFEMGNYPSGLCLWDGMVNGVTTFVTPGTFGFSSIGDNIR